MSESVWSKAYTAKRRPALSGDISAQAAVIGGGLAGVLIARLLQDAGVRVVLLEAAQIGSGQTMNTTAKVTAQHGLIYNRLYEKRGAEFAGLYAKANFAALAELSRFIKNNKIDCDFTEAPSYLYSTEECEALYREFEAVKALGLDAELCTETELPFKVAAALRFNRQAQLHPLKLLCAAAEPLEIYEGSAARSVEGNRVLTDRGSVSADSIVLACHYPFVNVPGFYFIRMHQERSYVLALKNAAKAEGMYLGVGKDGFSFRTAGDVLLFGGGSHRTGENKSGGKYAMLREAAKRLFPDSCVAAHWSAQDCMTADAVPYIGAFSAAAPQLYVATGFGKWGMTTSMVSAMLIRDMIVNKKSRYEKIFSPQRFSVSLSAASVANEAAHAVRGIARSYILPPDADIEALPTGHGGVVEADGKKIGVYKDESGEVFCVSVRCPHLGCRLEWNPDEKSWDCPCHGSRFDYRGVLIDNPAQKNLKTL